MRTLVQGRSTTTLSAIPAPIGRRAAAIAVGVLALTLAGCSLLPGDGASGDEVVADSLAADSIRADSLAADSAAAAADSTAADSSAVPSDSTQVADSAALPDSISGQLLPGEIATVDLLARLLANQERMTARLDSMASMVTTSEAASDSSSAADQSSEVLDVAGQQVRNFGVKIFWSIILVIVFAFLVRTLVWILDTLAERNAQRRLFFKRLVPVLRIVLWVFAAYLIVRVVFQITVQGLLAAAAGIGVAIGFAAQDLLKNLFGGLILVFDQPFQAGDKISIGGTYGEVVSIGLRSTRIVTPDDNLVTVPNSQVVDQQVANANAGELNCQVVTDLYLPGWADEKTAKTIAFQAAASSKYVYVKKPIVVLVADQFKETFLTRVRVKAYVLDPRLEFLFQSDVTERARAGFREAGLLTPEHMRVGLVELSSVGVSQLFGSAGSSDTAADDSESGDEGPSRAGSGAEAVQPSGPTEVGTVVENESVLDSPSGTPESENG